MTTILVFKNEGEDDGQIIGPLWYEQDGEISNHRDSKIKKADGGFFAKWVTLKEAREIAKKEGLLLEE